MHNDTIAAALVGIAFFVLLYATIVWEASAGRQRVRQHHELQRVVHTGEYG